MPYLSVIDAQKTVHDLRDEIARILADEEWNAETAGRIADLLIANGRDLTPTQEYPDDIASDTNDETR